MSSRTSNTLPSDPFVAVADVRSDGTATVWSQIGQLQASRARLANILGLPPEKVVVRWLDHAGQFGRKTFGGDGRGGGCRNSLAANGPPGPRAVVDGRGPRLVVRFSRLVCGCQSRRAVDRHRKTPSIRRICSTRVRSAPSWPECPPERFASAGSWTRTGPTTRSRTAWSGLTRWTTSRGTHRYGGLRGLIMRTPGQRQNNFVLESLVNEAAAVAKADPIQFRLDHTPPIPG